MAATILTVCGYVVVHLSKQNDYKEQWSSFYNIRDRDASIVVGNEIVAAIKRYVADHGRPPNGLDQLCPGYLTEIVSPAAGSGIWRYSIVNNELGFDLSFGVGEVNFPVCYYRDDTWIIDD